MAIELSEQIRFYGKEALEGRLNVATITERNAIPLGERYNGMIVTVRAEGKRYELLYDGDFEALAEAAKDTFLSNNDNWAESVGGGSSETPLSIKTKYESNDDTNAFTDADKLKLSNIEAEATKNEDTDDLDEGENNKYFTEARAVGSKLAGYVKSENVEALTSSKTVIEALSILEKALDGKVTLTPGGQLVVAAEKNRWNDTYTKAETDNKIDEKLNNLVWRDAVENASDLPTTYPDAVEGWAAIVNSENALYRFNGTSWGNIGNFIIPKATASVDGLMSKEDFAKLRDIEAEATKNDNTDDLDEGPTNKYFTDARAVAAKIAGYVKAGTPIPLEETDSILAALGKLERGLDDRLALRGDNFICTRPGSNGADNWNQLIDIVEEAGAMEPGGNPLGSDNWAYVLIFPGQYDGFLSERPLQLKNYVALIGIGSAESIVLKTDGNYNGVKCEGITHTQLTNFTIDSGSTNSISITGVNTANHVFRDLRVSGSITGGNGNGSYHNIDFYEASGSFSIDVSSSGHFRDVKKIYLSADSTIREFSGTIENSSVVVSGNYHFKNGYRISNSTIELSSFFGAKDFRLLDGKIFNSEIISSDNLIIEGVSIRNSNIDCGSKYLRLGEGAEVLDTKIKAYHVQQINYEEEVNVYFNNVVFDTEAVAVFGKSPIPYFLGPINTFENAVLVGSVADGGKQYDLFLEVSPEEPTLFYAPYNMFVLHLEIPSGDQLFQFSFEGSPILYEGGPLTAGEKLRYETTGNERLINLKFIKNPYT